MKKIKLTNTVYTGLCWVSALSVYTGHNLDLLCNQKYIDSALKTILLPCKKKEKKKQKHPLSPNPVAGA